MDKKSSPFKAQPDVVVENPWRSLRQFTDARIGIGRSGVSVPTSELLKFQLAHARARDAVHMPLNSQSLSEQFIGLQQQYSALHCAEPFCLASEAIDRPTYLQRPDLGRRLDAESREQLQLAASNYQQPFDLAIVVADGLSASAIEINAVPFIETFIQEVAEQSMELNIAPLTFVAQGRVAIADDVGALLNASATLMLIGERPGLSSPDSLGLYLTYAPEPGLTDDRRNCISNVRNAGLPYSDAAKKVLYLLREAKRLKTSGVAIKDRSEDSLIDTSTSSENFLLGKEQ